MLKLRLYNAKARAYIDVECRGVASVLPYGGFMFAVLLHFDDGRVVSYDGIRSVTIYTGSFWWRLKPRTRKLVRRTKRILRYHSVPIAIETSLIR